jgi:hypothetical protein
MWLSLFVGSPFFGETLLSPTPCCTVFGETGVNWAGSALTGENWRDLGGVAPFRQDRETIGSRGCKAATEKN